MKKFIYLNYWGAFYFSWYMGKNIDMCIYPICRDICIALYKILPKSWYRIKKGQTIEDYFDRNEPKWNMLLNDYKGTAEIYIRESRMLLWTILMFNVVLVFIDLMKCFLSFSKGHISFLSFLVLFLVSIIFDIVVDKKIGGKERFVVFRRKCERKKKKTMHVFIGSYVVSLSIALILLKL